MELHFRRLLNDFKSFFVWYLHNNNVDLELISRENSEIRSSEIKIKTNTFEIKNKIEFVDCGSRDWSRDQDRSRDTQHCYLAIMPVHIASKRRVLEVLNYKSYCYTIWSRLSGHVRTGTYLDKSYGRIREFMYLNTATSVGFIHVLMYLLTATVFETIIFYMKWI